MPEPEVPQIVRQHAEQHAPRCLLGLPALTEAGLAGYRRAQERFDPQRGAAFDEYARWWVRQAITRAIADSQRGPSAGAG